MSRYIGVILAGGKGKRMGHLGEVYPKALLPIANQPLIGHHLTLLKRLGVRDVYIVVGHRAPMIVQAVGSGERYGVHIEYVEQAESLGSAHAVGRLRSLIRAPFFLILGDYYFWPSDPGRLLRRLDECQGSAISVKREPDRRLLSEACEVETNAESRVQKIVEKPSEPNSDLKGCGFYALEPQILDAVAKTPRTALRDEYEFTLSLQLHVEAGHRLYAEEIIVWDSNLTRPEDLLECNLSWLSHHDKNQLVAEGVHIENPDSLKRVVVGAGAWIAPDASLTDVVVFPGSRVAGGKTLRRALVTPDELYFCG